MEMTPRIAIPLPTWRDLEYNRINWPSYATAVREAGGEAVEVPLDLSARALSALAESCDAILLPGSPADVDPARYGQTRDSATAPADANREATDRALIELAGNELKPLLCICYGMQMLNVQRGGTLLQDLVPLPVPHSNARSVLVAHSVAIASDSHLARLCGAEEAPVTDGFQRLPVNSSHHQAVGLPGQGVRVVARCPQDGVAEAIELVGASGQYLVAVQWHPERTTAVSAASRAIFASFVEAAGVTATRRSSTMVAL